MLKALIATDSHNSTRKKSLGIKPILRLRKIQRQNWVHNDTNKLPDHSILISGHTSKCLSLFKLLYNKIPQAVWLKNSKNSFLTVPEPENQGTHNSVSSEDPLPHRAQLLTVSSHAARDKYIREQTPFMRALSQYQITSLRHHFLLPSLRG